MNNNHFYITRRESIKKMLLMTTGLSFFGALPWPFQTHGRAAKKTIKKSELVEGIGLSPDYSINELVKRVFEANGGIGNYISKGDVVVIKPNLSWARPPHLAATTNPEVLESVIELCMDAGAKKVRIADNTIHNAKRCFAITGAGAIAKKTGADLIFPRSSLMRDMNLHGDKLDVWPVFSPLVESDKIINLPIAKHHSLSSLTLGMKNWIGAVGGSRWSLHQDIHQSIVDLAQFFKPTITLIDAIRILIKNGPSGGSPSYVKKENRLLLSTDPVAADAGAAALFKIRPEKIAHIRLADKWGLGTLASERIIRKEITI